MKWRNASTKLGYLLGLNLILCLTAAMGQTYQRGDMVVVIRDGDLRRPEGKVADVWAGSVLRVQSVKDSWLWLGQGQSGWLDKSHVIPVNRAAIQRLSELLRSKPTARLYAGRADVRRALGDVKDAINDYDQAIRLESENASWYNSRGLAYASSGNYERADQDYAEAIRIDPKFALAFNNRGNLYLNNREFTKAIDAYTQALAIDPKLAIALNGRATAWWSQGDHARAIEDYTEALRVDPTLVVAYNGRGMAYASQKEYGSAIEDYDHAIRVDPRYGWTYNNLAWILATCPDEQFRDGRRSVELATKACELSGWKGPNQLGTLAASHAEVGDFAKAMEMQKKAVELAPDLYKAEFQKRLDLFASKQPLRIP